MLYVYYIYIYILCTHIRNFIIDDFRRKSGTLLAKSNFTAITDATHVSLVTAAMHFYSQISFTTINIRRDVPARIFGRI